MNYFQLLPSDCPRWTLSMKNKPEINQWQYSLGQRLHDAVEHAEFQVDMPGPPVDYNITLYGADVVSRSMASALSSATRDLQVFPTKIENESGDWFILNVTSVEDCIAKAKSIIQYYPSTDDRFPEEPRGVIRLVIDPARVTSCVFRVKTWDVATIVNENVKKELETANVCGVSFLPVTFAE